MKLSDPVAARLRLARVDLLLDGRPVLFDGGLNYLSLVRAEFLPDPLLEILRPFLHDEDGCQSLSTHGPQCPADPRNPFPLRRDFDRGLFLFRFLRMTEPMLGQLVMQALQLECSLAVTDLFGIIVLAKLAS